MKVGDLVICTEALPGQPQRKPCLLVDIDPLRNHPNSWQGSPGYKMIEIVVLLPDGRRWHAGPKDWEVVSESR